MDNQSDGKELNCHASKGKTNFEDYQNNFFHLVLGGPLLYVAMWPRELSSFKCERPPVVWCQVTEWHCFHFKSQNFPNLHTPTFLDYKDDLIFNQLLKKKISLKKSVYRKSFG